jgi:hypothetical protein
MVSRKIEVVQPAEIGKELLIVSVVLFVPKTVLEPEMFVLDAGGPELEPTPVSGKLELELVDAEPGPGLVDAG